MSKYDRINYIKSNDNFNQILTVGETVLWHGKPKKSAFVLNKVLTMLPIAALWLAFDSVFIVSFIASGDFLSMLWFIIPFFALHLMPVWIWLSNVITAKKKWENTSYIITDKRIIIQSGFIGLDYQTIYYKDIKNVRLQVGAVDKLLKVGDIYLDCNVGVSQGLFDIENPYEIYPKIQKTIMDIQTDMHYPNNLRPDQNDGYQTKYNSNF